jgi:hypothetical protein
MLVVTESPESNGDGRSSESGDHDDGRVVSISLGDSTEESPSGASGAVDSEACVSCNEGDGVDSASERTGSTGLSSTAGFIAAGISSAGAAYRLDALGGTIGGDSSSDLGPGSVGEARRGGSGGPRGSCRGRDAAAASDDDELGPLGDALGDAGV